MNPLKSTRSRTESHLHQVLSNRSEIRPVDALHAVNDEDLLAQIGYKQELNRHFSTLQVFGISFSIMGILPSISSTVATGLKTGPVGLVWGWFTAGVGIFCVGFSLTILGSSIPTSGGLYYYTNYYAPSNLGVPLSFVIGCSNSVGLCGAICSIAYGFSIEVLSAVFIGMEGEFEITNAKAYGLFAACVVSNVLLCSITTKYTAFLQSISIFVNVSLVLVFVIAVPAGAAKNGFNNAHYIFGTVENFRTWPQGWSFVLSLMPAVWTIGAFDSVIHCSEEAKNAQRAIPFGILGSIGVCWVMGWAVCIVSVACIKGGDTLGTLQSATGNPMAQIIFDALGKKWAVAFMSLVAVGQYLMSCSIMIAASRQIWAFARDDGLPFHSFVKVVDPKIKVPIRATLFAGIFSLLMGLLVLINGTAGSGALFSLAVASNALSWVVPVVLVLLPTGQRRFVAGPFYPGKTVANAVHGVTVLWISFVIVMSMFPDNREVNKNTMNYTCAINVGVWVASIVYYYVHAYKFYNGPKSNLELFVSESGSFENIENILEEKN